MTSALETLQARWRAAWPAALATWSKFTRLSEPRWCFTPEEEKREGLTSSFAMIRLVDHAVVISLEQVRTRQLQDFGVEILAHEIGHHVYAPADLTDHGRLIARVRWGLPQREYLSGLVSNLYTDLLINDRLQRSAGLSMAQVYQRLGGQAQDRLWTLYMRMYEILWSLTSGTLAPGPRDARLEADAHLGARLIRVYAKDWLDGAGRFAALCLPYVEADNAAELQKLLGPWRDTENAGAGGLPDGLAEIDPEEAGGAIHPALDPELSGLEAEPADDAETEGQLKTQEHILNGARGQYREPFQYGEILRALGIQISEHDIAIRYYRERATPYLVPFPIRVLPESTEPLPEGLEAWDIGAPLENADWMESVLISPRVIPGLTTVQRVWGTTQGSLPEREPLDLDLYVDSSGSIPNPQRATSFLTLAGAIVALSALRTGSRVQVTLWSGPRQFRMTDGFVRDEQAVLGILTDYFGGSTAFPIHVLRDTYAERTPRDRPVHILIISDDGVTTMFDQDELKQSGWDTAQRALERGRGGGTMVLNLYSSWENNPALKRAHDEQGWQISVVRTWEELVEFARVFSQLKYGGEPGRP